MLDYYFPAELVPEITSGRKNRIVAALPASGLIPSPGSRVQLYCGSGKKDRVLIAQGRICAVRPVLLWGDLMAVDGHDLSAAAAEDFALAEGFASFAQFNAWCQAHHALPFSGYLAEWEARPIPIQTHLF
ncbi:hypothetical protein [Herminiimonas sp. CN]|uniref:hypothetical protein n=1 Tax=Herminiimonas sp. CN TaxID=1349818 RepID=UPI0012DF5B87|nr:hypothetical protein [Herminiimonas sp. CN]